MAQKKLWVKELENRAEKYPLYSQEGKGMQAKVIAKFFNPYGAGTWIITEASKQENGDWLLFGYCHIHEWEWGYITLSQLENARVNVWGVKLPLERDIHISKEATVEDLIA